MIASSDFRLTRIALNNGSGHMPALGCGTLIPDAAETIAATRDALAAGFRHFDCAERYRNEREVGEALQEGLAAGGIAREDIFVTTKLWNYQSSARARRTGLRGESGQTRAQLSGSLPHSHSVCISTGGRAGPTGSKRQCHLRQRSDFARYLESNGKSRGPRQMPGHRTVGHQLERTAAHLRICTNQASRGPGRSPSVSAGSGASGILQGERYCVFGFRAIGSWNAPGAARRSSHFGDRRTSWKDAGTGAAGMGGAARHGCAYHTQNCGSREREF